MRLTLPLVCAVIFAMSACQTTGDPSSPAGIAATLANAAVEAALAESLKPEATRESIINAGLTEATRQAMVLAPQLVADPVWIQSIRTAISLAIILSKSDESTLTFNKEKALAECISATRSRLE